MNTTLEKHPHLLSSIITKSIFEDIIPTPIIIKCGEKEVRYVDYKDTLQDVFESIIKEINFSELQTYILHERYYGTPVAFETLSRIYHTSVEAVLDEFHAALKLILAQYPKIIEKLMMTWVQENPEEAAKNILFLQQQVDTPPKEKVPAELNEGFLATSLKNAGFIPQIYNKLNSENIFHIIDLVQFNEAEIRITRGIGKESIKKIQNTLSQNKLKLGMELSPETIESVRAKIAENESKQ